MSPCGTGRSLFLSLADRDPGALKVVPEPPGVKKLENSGLWSILEHVRQSENDPGCVRNSQDLLERSMAFQNFLECVLECSSKSHDVPGKLCDVPEGCRIFQIVLEFSRIFQNVPRHHRAGWG